MNTEWYEKVAALTKRREKAKNYIQQWQQQLDEAEEQLKLLALESVQEASVVTTAAGMGEWTVVRTELHTEQGA